MVAIIRQGLQEEIKVWTDPNFSNVAYFQMTYIIPF